MINIKVRAWDTERKRYWSAEEMGQDQLTLSTNGRGFINVSGISTRLSHYLSNLIPELSILSQDIKGQEIYQNDIVKFEAYCEETTVYEYFIGVVKYCEEKACYMFGDFRLEDIDNPEVIGKLRENPELLVEKMS